MGADRSSQISFLPLNDPIVETLLADGLQFVRLKDQSYDRLLFKEVVHHFDQSELPEVFEKAFSQLRPGGRLLIMTR